MQLKKWGIYLACCLRRNRGHHGRESLVTGAWDRWSHRVSSQEAEREQRVGQAYSVSKPTPSDPLPSMFHHVTSSWSYITFQNSATSRDQVFKYVRLWGTFQMKIITQLLYASCKHTYFVCVCERRSCYRATYCSILTSQVMWLTPGFYHPAHFITHQDFLLFS